MTLQNGMGTDKYGRSNMMKTNDNRYTEQDWKLFKSRIAGWQIVVE